MSDNPPSPRKPFGERDEAERQLPFGARRRHEAPPEILPTTPYTRPSPPPPAPEPEPGPPAPPETQDEPEGTILIPEDISSFDYVTIEEEPSPPPRREEVAPAEFNADDMLLPSERRTRDQKMLKGRKPAPPTSMVEDEPEADEAGSSSQIVIRFGVLLKSVATMFGTAAVIATLFTWWTPDAFLPRQSIESLAVARATQSAPEIIPTLILPTHTPIPALNRIGIVSGHKGLNPSTGLPDPGAICADGVTEQEVNERVANQVAASLRAYDYDVDILEEFDPRLQGYHALAMVSIHSDSCEYINDVATGYKIASFAESESPEEDARLVECLSLQYGATTGLPSHQSVTYDMTLYHNFREIDGRTPGAIIEIGFLLLDKELLVEHSDVVALGIVRGVLCYLQGGPYPTPTSTPVETAIPDTETPAPSATP